MSVVVNVSGTWKKTYPHINVNGTWKKILNIWVNKDGNWKKTFTYNWVCGDWGNCSATCGGGTQTRTVTCRRNDGITVDDIYCTSDPNAGTC